MPNALPVSRLINVSVTLTAQAAQSQNLSSLLILGTSDEIDVVERMRSFESLEEVADQFGTTAEEYLAALLWFQQAPQPTSLLIGRWVDVDSKGQLIGGALSAANQDVDSWTGIANGSFKVAVDGGAATDVNGLNFGAAANMNAVAAIIDAGLNALGADCIYDANFGRFVITSQTAGLGSSVSLLQNAAAGTAIAAQMAGTAVTGAYVADGLDAETAVAAVEEFNERFGQQWYAVTLLGGDNADTLAIAAFVEATDTKHFLGVTTQDANILNASDVTNIAYQLKALGYKKTAVQYSSTNPYAVVSMLGRILTVDYDGNGTVITLMYKDEPGIAAEALTSSQAAAIDGFNANVFAAYDNDTAIIQTGVTPSGEFIDTVIGSDWLAVTIMTALYNLLYTSPTKIPQTDSGVNLLVTTIDQVCGQGVTNGLLAPGIWNSAGFGTLKQGDFLSKGWYTYAQPIAQQSQAGRAARRSPPIQVAAKLAGAVHTVDVAVTINQ